MALFRSRLLAGALMLPMSLVACGDDDDGGGDLTTFEVVISNVGSATPFPKSGTLGPDPIGPGGAYEVTFTAPIGSRLSFATMFVPSNDFFYAPDEAGIALYDGRTPVTGDVTAQVELWDAGTEIDQPLGEGPDQVQRQGPTPTGAADPDNTVRLVPANTPNLPAVTDVIQVELAHNGGSEFTLTVTNVSTATTLTTSGDPQAVPLSPGVWVVHNDDAPLFTVGQADRGEGLESIAEDGVVTALSATLDAQTGITVPLSPGLAVVHTEPNVLFAAGNPDRGEGLEAIAEDGMPAALAAALEGADGVQSVETFSIPDGGSEAGGIGPGGSYTFRITASPGDRLSLATMFVASNDLFYAPEGAGIALFDGAGEPLSGEIAGNFDLWDVGSEVNEEPGIGPNQVQRQDGPNSGENEDGTVQLATNTGDGFTYPVDEEVLSVTLSVVSQ